MKVFSNESALHIRWPEYWSFSFSIIPSNEYSEFISFRIDWFDLHVVQGILKSLQHHSLKASFLWCFSAFFTVQLSHPYMTFGKKDSFDSRDVGMTKDIARKMEQHRAHIQTCSENICKRNQLEMWTRQKINDVKLRERRVCATPAQGSRSVIKSKGSEPNGLHPAAQ